MQSALSEDDWRPGFAKRAPNFDAVCEQARAWRWSPGESIARIAAAVLKGTPTLTIQQRMTLLLYVEHLNQDRLEKDVACVWPSTALIADYLGCSESTARANRRGLEAAGYMVRDYNRANRPAGVEAYDLAPLVARLDEMEAADAAFREAAQARRAQYLEPVVFAQRYAAQAPISRRLEQSHKNDSSSVQDKAAPSSRSSSFARPATPSAGDKRNGSSSRRHGSGTSSAICSPEGASGLGGAQSAPSAAAEMVRQELRAAVQVCPRLAALVGDHILADPASAGPADVARIAAAAETWLPEIERNNALSVGWGWARHGPRVIAMLAIALEDPAIQSPCKYFGWMVTRTPQGAPDLRLNLARIMRVKGEIPPADQTPAPEPAPLPLMFAPGADEAPWPEINAEILRLIKMGAHGSWFGGVGFHGISDGVITLSTPTAIAADRIKRDYIDAIKLAAEAVGVFVDRVVLTVRKR